ncbi:MAG: HPr family phosphocarrier protein [Actinomycetota bacterium]
MPEATITLRNPTGLHARPAKIFAQTAATTAASVTVRKDGREVNGKSVLSVLTLDCHQGDDIVIRTEGEGADAALKELVRLVEGGMGE